MTAEIDVPTKCFYFNALWCFSMHLSMVNETQTINIDFCTDKK